MKVYIGPYKNWWGPYQLAELIPFVSEDTHDKIGAWLAKTWVMDACQWVHKLRGDRTVKVRIDKSDTWSMDGTLAHIILPMLKQLRDTKHGSPMVDDEDVPPHMRYDGDNWIHYKWEWVLNEMIFAFEGLVDDSWEDKFYHGEPEYVYTPVTLDSGGVYTSFDDAMESDGCFRMEQTNPDYWVDFEGIRAYNARMANGFRLFGKYYQNLWD